MRVLSDEEDRKFRKKIREEVGFRHEPCDGWEPLDIECCFTVDYSHENYERNFQKTLDLVRTREDSFFILAFEEGQYVPDSAQKFKEDMDEKIVEVSYSELEKITHDLIIVYILPESLDWIILLDHDGNIHLSGEIEERARTIFDEG